MDAKKAFWLFVAFAVLVFLMGGGSRNDIESIGPLRGISCLFLAVALFFQTEKSLRRIAFPLGVIAALAVWMGLQLIPLPPSVWTSLPGRDAIAGLGGLVGLDDVWRPITFSPVKTANSLASLIVPLAGLMLLGLLDEKRWMLLPWVFIAAGVVSALFGIAQVLGGAEGLYLYQVTNDTSAVGLFANRNHNAIFLVVSLLFASVQLEAISRKRLGFVDLAMATGALVIFAGILVNASRTGLVGLGFVGLVFSVRALWGWYSKASTVTGAKKSGGFGW